VERIFEAGNAAVASKGDKIQVGDQLAAINGASAINKNVGDICRVLAKAPKPDAIDLTFVRYIGPLRPASNEQLGYEVIDPDLRAHEVIDPKLSRTAGRFSPINIAKKLSLQKNPKSPHDNSGDESQQAIKMSSNKIATPNRKARSVSRSPQPAMEGNPSDSGADDQDQVKKKKRFAFLRRRNKKNK